MAKLTVFFNDKPVESRIFEKGIIHIGRDITNDIQIDSLAVAPAHAAVIINNSNCSIRYLNDSFPLYVNIEKIKDHSLKDGDRIGLGKHIIVYNETEKFTLVDEKTGKDTRDYEKDTLDYNVGAAKEPDAFFQVISGKHLGRVIALKKALTKVGQSGNGVVVIAKRKDGYFISSLENNPSMKVNDQMISEDTIKLQADDIVEMEAMSLQFFMG